MDAGIVLLLGLLVLVYLNFAGRRRAQRDRVALLQRLVPGAQVVTTSGLHATVTEVSEDGSTVLLESAPGRVTRWEKLAVGRVLDSPVDAVAEEPAEGADPVETIDPVEPPLPAGERAVEPSTEPPVEPGARRLPDSAPPDRA